MNLITPSCETSVIATFRYEQYQKINYLLDLGIRYLQNLGLQVDPNVYQGVTTIFTHKNMNYEKINHFASTQFRIKINNEDKQNFFLSISIPDLIDGIFFKLNQTYYIPILYITDEPIVVKESSIKLDSLFQPITLFFKEGRIIFLGNNFGMSDFLNFITYSWNKDLRDYTQKFLGLDFSIDLNPIISLFAEKFNCLQNYDVIKQRIEDLFFDEWTLSLYNKYYKVNTFDDVIQLSLKKRFDQLVNGNYHKFNDLRYKRLIFIEMLLKPYFKAISSCAKAVINNIKILNSRLKLKDIIDNFFANLNGNSLYDTVNGFSGILAHKATFKNPFGSGELPQEVSSIHWTHKNRICPNSISNHDSGQDVFLVPNQKIDLDYGIFHFEPEELELPS